jgi:hypothetical protein
MRGKWVRSARGLLKVEGRKWWDVEELRLRACGDKWVRSVMARCAHRIARLAKAVGVGEKSNCECERKGGIGAG